MSEPTPPPPPPASEPSQPTSSGGGSAGNNKTLMLILAYLGPLALVPFLVEKDDQEVQWHAKHGIVLMLLWIAISIVFTILTSIPVFGCAVALVSLVVPLIALVVHILCIVKALNGQRFLIPGVSQYADKF
ncbi:MAG: DUF4870 domain-containing protein [Acidobacteriota bacterium]|nr:DUF4870 domain-containing protein [Acidobacteriota bacterium]MDH3522084.1 DUF4870 domain-containing protein [Acidobacteriota bacterium]